MEHDASPLAGPLISAATLRDDPGGLRCLDVRGQGREAYVAAHLGGALYASLEEDLSDPAGDAARGGRNPLPPLSVWAATLGRWGITPSTRVVLYDDAGGANAACRAWWMLRAVGHEKVAVLDGGLGAAREAGVVISTEIPAVPSAAAYPVPDDGAWSLPTLSMEAVEAHRLDVDKRLIDVRAGSRFRGEEDSFDPIAGHIPGATNMPYAHNLGPDGRFLLRDELRALYEGVLDGYDAQATAVYCGSGVTACHALLALEQAGFPGASLYVGSWSEWSRSGRPRGSVLQPR